MTGGRCSTGFSVKQAARWRPSNSCPAPSSRRIWNAIPRRAHPSIPRMTSIFWSRLARCRRATLPPARMARCLSQPIWRRFWKGCSRRANCWMRSWREASASVARLRPNVVDNDIAVPLDKMQALVEGVTARALEIDPGLRPICVAHLGDGNLHFAGWPSTEDPAVQKAVKEAVDAEAIRLGGSISAEHGIGLAKRPAMGRYKDPVALMAMRAIKQALDPKGIMNPGKVLPADDQSVPPST